MGEQQSDQFRETRGDSLEDASDDLADTFPAQIETAMRAGWDDPIMDEYNDYDRHR